MSPAPRVRPARTWLAACVAGLLVVVATTAAAATDDPYRPQQWGMDVVGIEQAWQVTRGEDTVIAIVDSGIDLSHDDLATQILRDDDGEVVGRDLVDDDDTPQDEHGHGTMVAGIAAAAAGNEVGVIGAAPGSRLMPLRVLDADGGGAGDDVDEAIRWAVDHGADVINLSLESDSGSQGESDDETGPGVVTPLEGATAPLAAVEYAWEQGVIVVAAAGNSGNPFTDYPETSPVVLVGASDRDDGRAGFSDGGRDDVVLAPGVEIVSTWCVTRDRTCDGTVHNYGQADGTSFAAPLVSGVLAMLRGAGLDHEEAVQRLRETARDVGPAGRDAETGYGIVDAAAATSRPAPGGPSPAPTPTEPTPPARPGTTPAGSPPSQATAPPPVRSSPPAPDDGGAATESPSAVPGRGEVTADPASPPAPVAAPPPSDGTGPLHVAATAVVLLSALLWAVVRRRLA